MSRSLRDLCPEEADAHFASVDDVVAVELSNAATKAPGYG
jgi:hypothetical protein